MLRWAKIKIGSATKGAGSVDEPGDAQAEPTRNEDGPWTKLFIGLVFIPGIPWLFLQRTEKIERSGWWLKLIMAGFWLYAITCLVAGFFGLWALYVRKQSRDEAVVYGDEKAAAFWGNLIVGAIWLMLIGGGLTGVYLVYTRMAFDNAVIATLLFGILVALIALYDQQAKMRK